MQDAEQEIESRRKHPGGKTETGTRRGNGEVRREQGGGNGQASAATMRCFMNKD